MKNENTKQQIRQFIEKAIEEARNPDPRVKQKRIRKERAKKVSTKYGL